MFVTRGHEGNRCLEWLHFFSFFVGAAELKKKSSVLIKVLDYASMLKL